MDSTLINLVRPVEPNDNIPDFYAGKGVFITGASGFMGKVLVEKLLRACPDIGNIYLLLRPKNGATLESRKTNILNNVLFDTIRNTNPAQFEKVIPIKGDVKELNLGISKEDEEIIKNNVSIVYHVAATVRFNGTLEDSILINTRGTREVCNLVLSLKKVDAFLHVSTAYCQHDKSVIHEKLYPPPADWRKLITIVENTDPFALKMLSPKILSNFPNTYTFSKALAEAVVKDLCETKVPTIIFRPTIVISMYKDPMPGWNDNMNGPVGLMAARAKGVLRSGYVNFAAKIDFMSVDYAINVCIKATWIQKYLSPDEVAVYNCSSQGVMDVAVKDIREITVEVSERVMARPIWYPSDYITDVKIYHLINIYLFHLLPAVFVDLLLKFANKPPRLLKLQRRIFLALNCLEYFMHHQWYFHNDKMFDLDNYLNEKDMDKFYIDHENFDYFEYFTTGARVGMGLILKEDIGDIEKNKQIVKRMYYVHTLISYSAYLWLLVKAYHYILIPCFYACINYIVSLDE